MSLQQEVAELKARLAVVEAENVELRAKLGKNSQNSSKPPSSDPPGGPPDKPKKKRKKRKRGGQPGHKRKVATVPDRVDHVHLHRPETCKHCSADLAGGTLTGGKSNHFVYEIPPFKATVHDHQCIDVQCSRCGKVTRGKLPADAPAGNYDWSVQATVGYLRGDLRQSVRQVKQVGLRRGCRAPRALSIPSPRWARWWWAPAVVARATAP